MEKRMNAYTEHAVRENGKAHKEEWLNSGMLVAFIGVILAAVAASAETDASSMPLYILSLICAVAFTAMLQKAFRASGRK